MTWIGALAALGLSCTVALAEGPSCASFAATAGDASLDLAPPSGFVEICGQDRELCQVLTAGYPPSSKTLGYFVTLSEWEQFKKAPIGFTRYLIAQLAGAMSPSDLPGLKEYIRSQQGEIPDHTALPSVLKSVGQAPIAVFVDTEDALAFGVITKLQTKPPATPKDTTLASTNAALVVKNRVLSLYAFLDITESNDVDAVKKLTREWLTCLRSANAR